MEAEHLAAVREWLGGIESLDALKDAFDQPIALASIVMSHRGRAMERDTSIRAAIERVLEKLHRDKTTLLVSPETPLGSFLLKAAVRLGVSLRTIESPTKVRTASDGTAWIDRALISIPEKVYVVEVRPESKTVSLLLRRLKDPRFPIASVYVEVQPPAVATSTNEETTSIDKRFPARSQAAETLLEHGSVAHLYSYVPMEASPTSVTSVTSSFPAVRSTPAKGRFPTSRAGVVPLLRHLPNYGDDKTWPYLTHCTRACHGPWPDQSVEGYFDDLLAAGSNTPTIASPLATLKRILEQQRLVATKRLKRADTATVSLSAVPLPELLSRRCFRRHLGRWDWEPYGLCFHRERLASMGARSVVYRSAAEWDDLPAADRPFFQPNDADRKGTNAEKDEPRWEEEREWRVLDDLHLAGVPFEAGFVFVPTTAEAMELAELSRFPILSLEGTKWYSP